MITDLRSFRELVEVMRENKVSYVKLGDLEVRLSAPDNTLNEALSEYTTPSPAEPSADEILFWSSK